MHPAQIDLIITAARVKCPSTGLDGLGAVGVADGVISFVRAGNDFTNLPRARKVVHYGDGILLPGLIDLHAHPANGGSRFGVDPDAYLLPRGSTTVLSQGDAGARNLDAYRRHTVAVARTRVRVAVNFCADGESNPAGRFHSLSEASIDECVAAIARGGSDVWGISLNIAFIRGKDIDPLEVLRRGIAAAEQADCPVMFGATKDSVVPLEKQLKHLRPGDVMTYCFHSGEGSIVQGGRILDCIWDARERGVLFDVGDGTAAFGYDVAEAAIAEGFLPDTISSDFYRHHVANGVPHDLPRVVSKLVAAGMTPEQCWPRITSVPARILRMTGEVGSLRPGARADLTVLAPSDGPTPVSDGHGAVRNCLVWEPEATYKGGELV